MNAEIRRQVAAAIEAKDMARLVELAKASTTFLSPMFHLIPWDERAIISEARFREAYAWAAKKTGNFTDVSATMLASVIAERPSTLVVFRTIAGYRVQELSYVLASKLGCKIGTSAIKTLEACDAPATPKQVDRVATIARALFEAVEGTLLPRAPEAQTFVDRHDKFDTLHGWESVGAFAQKGVPYASALYERYLGRPFAYVVDALSGMKAELLEGPIEVLFQRHGIPYYRTKAIERIPGFEQAPDFLVPDATAPRIVIEAKLAEDGGTARDKASRIERLSRAAERRGCVLIAVVDGKGFFRINDVLVPILRVTKGLTFTLSTLPEMVSLSVFDPFRKV